jgi:putative endopeptidase
MSSEATLVPSGTVRFGQKIWHMANANMAIVNRRRLTPVLATLAAMALAVSAEPAPGATGKASHLLGLDLPGMDRSVAPGDDFFAYANGTWFKKTAIPADRSSIGSGERLIELTDRRTAALIKDAATNGTSSTSPLKKIGDYYASYMDAAAIEAKGLTPLQPALARIAAISDRQGLARELGGTLRTDVDALNYTRFATANLFGLWVAQDLNDSSRYAAFLLQGGLGMPDRSYYLDPSQRMKDIRARYLAHIANVLRQAKLADPEAKAARVFDLEYHIAEAHWPRVDSENVLKANNQWMRRDFDSQAPGIIWGFFFAAAGLEQQASFTVWQPSAITGISALVAREPLDTWKEYLTFHAIDEFAEVLPKVFVDEDFAFYGKTLSGTPKQRDRWKRAVSATNRALGEAVGELYVKHYFPPDAKARIEALVQNLLVVFARRIDSLGWMTTETKTRAKAKLATLRVGVGYPDKWIDYTGLQVIRGDAFGNAQRADSFDYQRNLRKLSQPVDRGEWVMTPQTVNAVNLPVMNALNFPAAILQPPYFDPSRPTVMDYGAIGATIGHEISHSFDDQGALFDASGRLNNWWTKEDLAHFRAAAKRLIKQYDLYRPFPDLAVNGSQTISENIADVAGLAVAYDAYRLSLQGKPAPRAQNFNGDQQFFLSFAQSWREKEREPALRRGIVTDGHAPDEYRADTVRNLDAWYEAFAVKPGQKLYLAPQDRVQVW